VIKYSDVFDNLLDSNFYSDLSVPFTEEDVVDGSFQPLESGSKQRVTLALPKTTDDITYYIATRALNKNNAPSSTSNIVSVQIVLVKPPQTQPPTTRATTKAPETSTSVNTGLLRLFHPEI
jgi:calcium-activated chloride channel regulator 4